MLRECSAASPVSPSCCAHRLQRPRTLLTLGGCRRVASPVGELQLTRLGVEMAARPPLPRLLEQSLDQLKQLAAQRFLSKSGPKAELIRRLFESRWPKLRVMLDEREESSIGMQAVSLARQLGILSGEDGGSLEWALITLRGGLSWGFVR